METTKLISELLAVAIIVLMAVTIACPLVALIAQDTGGRYGRLRAGLVRLILRRLASRLDDAPRSGAAFRMAPQSHGATDRRADAPDRRRTPAQVHPRPGQTAPLVPAPALAEDRRGQKRFKTCFLGTLHRSSGADPENLCDILDLSAGGARVRPVDPMPARRQITLGLRHFGRLPARVVWRRGGELGLKFEQDPAEIMAIMQGLLPRGAFPQSRAA